MSHSAAPRVQPEEAARPRVVLVASIGFSLRNYVLGECLDRLAADAQVTVLTPLAESRDLGSALAPRGADLATLDAERPDPSWRRVRGWKQALHVAAIYNDTWRLKRSVDHHEATTRARIWNSLTFGIARVAVRLGAMRFVDRLEERRALASPAADRYRALFESLRPAVVCSTAPLMPIEWLPLQVARHMGIPTAAAVLSFDNVSSKGRLPPCDAVLVWSQSMANEVRAAYPEVEPQTVHVTGAPQFDYYRDPRYQQTRTEFFGSIGADPARRLIVYAGVTPGLMPHEPRVVSALAEALRRGEVRGTPQLLVRLHPKDDGARYADVKAQYPEVLFSMPGERHRGHLEAWQPVDEDIRLMVNTVRHGDVHINVASTMTIDASVADRPVINVRYDLRPDGARPSWGLFIYRHTHWQPVIRTGAMRMAGSTGELVAHINAYLERPELDQAGRARLVAQECGVVDGGAGRRAAEVLLALAAACPGARA